MSTRRALRRTLPLLLFLLSGCAPYSRKIDPVVADLRRGNAERGLATLEKRSEPDDVLWRMEHGLLLRACGRREESNADFEAASRRDEDLFTHSVSNEAASLAVNDLLRPYRAASYELPFLHFYPLLNFLEEGRTEDALVEARALSLLLEERADRDSTGDWSLGRLLCGFCFESAGEWNDAWIAYRAALTATRRDAGERDLEPLLVERCLRTSVLAGVADSGACPPSSREDDMVRVVCLVEEGTVPALTELHLRVPIFKEEESWGEDRLDRLSRSVGERALACRDHSPATGNDVAYLLALALPIVDPADEPPQEKGGGFEGLRVRVVPETRNDLLLPRGPSRSQTSCEEASRTCGVLSAEDVGGLLRRDLERRMPAIAARTAARALVKALLSRSARHTSGDALGQVVNALGVATEHADTRLWRTLPGRIGVGLVEVPAGSGRVLLQGAVEEPCGEYELPAGGWVFFTRRIIP